MAVGQSEKERFRSFAERYVIERAGHWKPGEEDTSAWAAIKDAKRVYQQIAVAGEHVQEEIARSIEHAAKTLNALQAGNDAAPAPSQGAYRGPHQLQQLQQPSMPSREDLAKALCDPKVQPTVKERIRNFLAGGPIV